MSKDIREIRQSREDTYKKMMRWLWIAVGAGVLGVILVFVVLSFTDLPSIQELENPKSELATEIYGDNLEVVGRYYTQQRVPVAYDALSPNLVEALTATEDERYYRHPGIDFRGLARAVYYMGEKGGASTITQQLAKLLFTGKKARNIRERIIQKLKEWIIAVKLERRYTKEEIIAMYFNKFDFINGAVGIKAATEIYFDSSPDSLRITEAALLVGMLQNPSLYNPNRFPEKSLRRRNVVLGQMYKNQLLTKAEFDQLKVMPLGLKFKRATQSEGLAPYFRAELAKDVKAILADVTKSDGTAYDIYEDGLKIYTTIHPEMQRIAEEEAVKHMQQLQDKFNRHWRNKDPWTYETYETTDRELEIRQETLMRMVRNSDRYRNLRASYMTDIIGEIESSISDLNIRDVDILRILEAEEDRQYLERLVRRNMISRDMESQYRKVMRHPSYDKLKAQWNKLETAAKVEFDKPAEMTVFAYNDKMQTDTTMSPMDSIKYHQMFLQIGSMGVNPKTGYVKFWVGGIDHRSFKFDHVRSRRQVGSTFKPFVYATAIAQKGFSPCFPVNDRPYSIHPGESSFFLQDEWMPSNSSNTFTYNDYSLKEALKRSKNSVTVYLMKEIGSVEPVVDLVRAMGVDTDNKYSNGEYIVPRVPSIALGAADLTVMEMTGAYTTFANNGYYNKPTYIVKIEDKDGRPLYDALPSDKEVLNPRYNYVMLEMLRWASSSARGFYQLKTPNGGKTGTTNDNVDGWYMGITPNLVVGTWAGGDLNWIRFRGNIGQGATMARPFFLNTMLAIEASEEIGWNTEARFERPPGDIGIELDCAVFNSVNTDGAFDESPGSIYDDGFGDELDFDLPAVDSSAIN
ncbi:MAG: transglycosylase domain-containing protein [Bacteroidota bacterium]